MKKITLLLLSVMFVSVLGAQVRFAVKGGLNLSSMPQNFSWATSSDNEIRAGFHFGSVVEIPFTNSLSLQPELLFSQNQIVSHFQTIDDKPKSIYNTINQLQLPINLKYTLHATDLNFFATVGTYFGYGIGGQSRVKGYVLYDDMFLLDDVVTPIYKSNYKRLDCGIGASIGIEVDKIMFMLGYQHGLVNLSSADNSSAKLKTFTLSVGYFF